MANEEKTPVPAAAPAVAVAEQPQASAPAPTLEGVEKLHAAVESEANPQQRLAVFVNEFVEGVRARAQTGKREELYAFLNDVLGDVKKLQDVMIPKLGEK